MSRTYVEQSQISATTQGDVNDYLTPSGGGTNLLADLNLIRTQIRKIIDTTGHWTDDPQLTIQDINMMLSPGGTLATSDVAVNGNLSLTQAGTTLNLSTPPDTTTFAALFGATSIVGAINSAASNGYAYYRKGYVSGAAVDGSGILDISSVGSLRSGWDVSKDISVYLNGALLGDGDFTVVDSHTLQFTSPSPIAATDVIGITLPNSDGTPVGTPYTPPPAVVMGGDTSGDSNASLVVGIRGRELSSNAPADGAFYKWNSESSQWVPVVGADDVIVIFGAASLNDGSGSQALIPGVGGFGGTSSFALSIPMTFNGTVVSMAARHASVVGDSVTYDVVKNGTTPLSMTTVVVGNNDGGDTTLLAGNSFSAGDNIGVRCSYTSIGQLEPYVTVTVVLRRT